MLLLGAYLAAGTLPQLGVLLRTPFSEGAEISCIHVLLSVMLFTLGLSTSWRDTQKILRELKWVASFVVIRGAAAALCAIVSAWLAPEMTGLMAGVILILHWCLHIENLP